MRKVSIKMETLVVTARPRKLGRRYRVNWRGRKYCYFIPLIYRLETPNTFINLHSLDMADQLEKSYLEQIL